MASQLGKRKFSSFFHDFDWDARRTSRRFFFAIWKRKWLRNYREIFLHKRPVSFPQSYRRISFLPHTVNSAHYDYFLIILSEWGLLLLD